MAVHDDGAGEREELHARREATQAAIEQLRELGEEDWTRDDTLRRMLAQYEFRHRRLSQRAGMLEAGDEEQENLDERSRAYQQVVRDVIGAQRRRIIELRDDGTISDEVLHALKRELDLEDQRLEI